MNFDTKPIMDWFGFTRRERRSTFALLLIVVIIIGFKYMVPDTRITIQDITDSLLVANDAPALDSGIQSGAYSFPVNSKGNGIKTIFGRKPKISRSTIKKDVSYSNQKQQLIEINRCDSVTLVRLPGIGPVLSARIIRYRRLLGGYARIEQLKEVYGLPEETYELIKNRISADSTFISRININTAGYKELYHIRYLERYEIASILKYRQLKVKINGIEDLIDNKVITKEKAKSVGPYLKFDE
jgi:DNA uptake protein and related DNA-binding proteins